MITVETFINEIENLKEDMLRELTTLSGKRDQLLKDIGKLNTLLALINEVNMEDENNGTD